MKMNKKQEQLVNATEHKILCLSSAASGKTAVLTERVRHLVKDCGVDPKDIVAITFTRLAAAEMRARLDDIDTEEMFIGTVHSYALKICGLNDISMYQAIREEEYDKILMQATELSSDKYTKIKHLLVDEAQDLTPLEYAFIEQIPTENIFYIGDVKQCIYTFRGASSEYMISKYIDDDYEKYALNLNYRNAPNILKFAEDFIDTNKSYSLSSIPIRKEKGILEVGIPFVDALADLEDSEDYKNWAILARTNNEVDTIQRMLEAKDIPYISFKKSDFDTPEQIEKAAKSNVVKVLTIHSSKGLEFPYVIVVGARSYNEAECNLSYVAATRAMRALYWCKAVKGAHLPRGTCQKTMKENIMKDTSMILF